MPSSSSQVSSEAFTSEAITVILLLVIFTVGLLVEAVDDWSLHHRAARALLQVVWRELTLLGLVACILFVVDASGVSGTASELLQSLHVTVALLVGIYIAVCAFVLWASRRLQQRWGALEAATDPASFAQLRDELAQLSCHLSLVTDADGAAWVHAACCHPRALHRYNRLLSRARFLEQVRARDPCEHPARRV